MTNERKKIVFEADVECRSCGATGLYQGMGERDGAAIVCYGCNGTGKFHVHKQHVRFTKRKTKKGVTHVYAANPGITVDGKGAIAGGVPFSEWLKDPKAPFRPGKEMRLHVCPAWWYQSADYKKKPEWDECHGFGGFSNCPSFKKKSVCWERWDKEHRVKKPKGPA